MGGIHHKIENMKSLKKIPQSNVSFAVMHQKIEFGSVINHKGSKPDLAT